jgi:hypothetical protein
LSQGKIQKGFGLLSKTDHFQTLGAYQNPSLTLPFLKGEDLTIHLPYLETDSLAVILRPHTGEAEGSGAAGFNKRTDG